VTTVISPWVKGRHSFISWRTISLWSKTLLHVVSELVHQDNHIQQIITADYGHDFIKLCEKASKLQYFKKENMEIIHYQICCYINKYTSTLLYS
jgi:hypothetical protein